MAEKYTYDKVPNWTLLSEKTKQDIMECSQNKKDIVGYIATKDITPTQLVQKFQSLVDPKFIGTLTTRDHWKSFHNTTFCSIIKNIEPYFTDGSMSSYPLTASTSTLNDVSLPLCLSHGKSPIIFPQGKGKCLKYQEILNMYKLKLGLNISIQSNSSQYSPFYKSGLLNKNNLTIFSQIGVGSDSISINQYEQIITINSYCVNKRLEDMIKLAKKSGTPILGKYDEKTTEYISNAIHDLGTLLLTRAISLGAPDIQYKIDEALKLQVSNSFALLASEGTDITKTIYINAEKISTDLIKDLGITVEQIVNNMQDMGYKYESAPIIISSALTSAYNFENRFNIEKNATTETVVAPELTEIPLTPSTESVTGTPVVETTPTDETGTPATIGTTSPEVAAATVETITTTLKKVKSAAETALAQAILLAGGVTKLRHIIPSYLDENVVPTTQRKKSLQEQSLAVNMCEDISRSLESHIKKSINNPILAQAVYANYFALKQDITNEVLDDFKSNRLGEEKPKSAKKRLHDTLYRRYATEEEKEAETPIKSGKLLRRGIDTLIERSKDMLENPNPVVDTTKGEDDK